MKVVRPKSEAELADWLASSSERFLEEGAPTVTGAPLERPPADLADLPRHGLSLGGLADVVDFRPRDLTITVGAGMRLSDLARVVEEEGLWLPLGGGRRDQSVGGWVASAPVGDFDESYGPVRRHVLACTLVLWDGRKTTWGRAVMKDVAGYDVTGLVCGSRARLGVVTSLTLRLWPHPRVLRRIELQGRALSEDPVDLHGAPRVEGVSWRAPAGGQDAPVAVITLGGGADSVSTRTAALERWGRDHGLVLREQTEGPVAESPAGERESRSSNGAAYRIRFGRRYLTAGLKDLDRRLTHEVDPWTMEVFPATGVVRLIAQKQKAAGQRYAPAWLTTLADSVGRPPVSEPTLETPAVRVERGGAAEHEAARRMRGTGPRDIEGRWVKAFGGLDAPWQADYL